MSIELRSPSGIRAAEEALRAGDYNDEKGRLHIKLHTPFFTARAAREHEDALQAMMGAAGQLPHITDLTITSILENPDGTRHCYLPASSVAAAIDVSGISRIKLESLNIRNVMLLGTSQDFEQLATALEDHPSLWTLSLQCGCLEQEWNSETNEYFTPRSNVLSVTPLDKVFQKLASIDSLGVIRLTGGIRSGVLSNSFLEQLDCLPKLMTLQILTFSLSDSALQTLAQVLETEELKTLNLCCDCLGMDGAEALKCLVENNPYISTLQIIIDGMETNADANLVLSKVMYAIGRSAMTDLYFDVGKKDLLSFVLENTRVMLRGNYGLEHIEFRYVNDEHKFYTPVQDNEVDFLLKTNKLGRGQIFKDKPSHEANNTSWMSMFEAAENDLSNIFYLVRSHPNEFVQMGINDCSQNMQPTIRSMKNALRAEMRVFKSEVQAAVKSHLKAQHDANLSMANELFWYKQAMFLVFLVVCFAVVLLAQLQA